MDTGIDNLIMAQHETAHKEHRQNRLLIVAAGVILLLAGVLTGSAMTAKGWLAFGSGGGKVPIYLASDQRVNQAINLNSGFSAVAKAVTPAVVMVNVYSRGRAQQQQVPFFMDPFRDYFNRPDQDDQPPPQRRRAPQTPQNPQQNPPQTPKERGRLEPFGSGSGVIVSPDGYILTNNHVVEDAEKVEVELSDRRVFTAKVVGTDQTSDVAVIKIEGSDFPAVPFGDSSKAEVGDIVLAIGNPLGVGQTVTMGILSAKGRRTSRTGDGNIENFLQTDASINRGNSGGALVNLQGELIGIPSQILSATGGSIGIGFAIPAEMARNVMEQLIRGGKVQRGMLGVGVRDLDPELAEALNKKDLRGALVSNVTPGEPADRAGVKPYDIITEFQGQPIKDQTQLISLVSQTAPGSTVKFKVWREGKELELTAKLVERKIDTAQQESLGSPRRGEASEAKGGLSGVRVEDLTPELAQEMKLPSSARGVIVTSVDPESNAAGRLRRGDVIEEVNRQPVSSREELNAALERAGKKSLLLLIRRQGGTSVVVVPPQD